MKEKFAVLRVVPIGRSHQWFLDIGQGDHWYTLPGRRLRSPDATSQAGQMFAKRFLGPDVRLEIVSHRRPTLAGVGENTDDAEPACPDCNGTGEITDPNHALHPSNTGDLPGSDFCPTCTDCGDQRDGEPGIGLARA